MTERLFIPDADEAEWIAKLTKRKHPADRAERLRINEEKKARKGKDIKSLSERPHSPVLLNERDH